MSAGRCSRCGAMSTIWLPTCVFCGQSLADSALAADGRPKPTVRVRREEPGFFRSFWARLTAIRR